MRGSKRLLTILFVLVLSGVAIAADATRTGDEYLEHTYVALGDELTVYDNPGLTTRGNSVETDELLIIDGFQHNKDYDRVGHIVSPEHLEGYVAVSELIEVMVVWSDTLSFRNKAGLSASKIDTAKRGEVVIYLKSNRHEPPHEDGYYWRKCVIGNMIGWVAEDFLIEKCYFDVLEPALELYDAGELRSMRTYLEELDRNYADIDCEIASDGRSAIVAFEGESCWYGYAPIADRVYLVGELDQMIYSNYIPGYFISDDGKYTFASYSPTSYGAGYYSIPPYTVFDNHAGVEVFRGYARLSPLYHLEEKYPDARLNSIEFVDESHLLVIVHEDYEEDDYDYTGELYPRLTLIDMTTGEGVVLLEPDWDWLEARGEGIYGGVQLRRNSNCSSPLPIIKAAMETNLFQLCEEELVRGFCTEG